MKQETVFKGSVEPLDNERMEILTLSLLAEGTGQAIDPKARNNPNWFLCAIIEKRIEGLKLPIKFTDFALIAHLAFSDRPAKSVIVLIDALTRYEGKTVTAEMLCELYPDGFYTEMAMIDYIDNYLKARKVKWSEIY